MSFFILALSLAAGLIGGLARVQFQVDFVWVALGLWGSSVLLTVVGRDEVVSVAWDASGACSDGRAGASLRFVAC
jgi:hypothetical protein